MGRAIVREPKAFLMDEPLSNLDAKLRVSMRAELAKLHERLGVTTVYVTHDQVEAMTLGQRVAVLRDGLLQQVDTPQNLFHEPVNLFVAAFIGSPSMNLIDADVANRRVSFANFSFELPESSPAAGVQGRLILGIRPTDFEHGSTADPELPRVRVQPDVVEDLGSERHVIFTLDAPRVTAEAVRAASDEGDDEGKLFADDRAVFTARARRAPRDRVRLGGRAGGRPAAAALLRSRDAVWRSPARRARASSPLRDAEQRGLDVPQPVDVAAHPGGGVVEQERLGELHDRVGERRRLDRRLVGSVAHLVLDQARDVADHAALGDAVHRQDAERRIALLLDEAEQRRSLDELPVEAVERVEESDPARSLRLGARLIEQRLACLREHLTDQTLA